MYVGETEPYNLRKGPYPRVQRVTTLKMQKSLFIVGLQLYSRLPSHQKVENYLIIFYNECVNVIRNYLI